jgi:hypothetical protein
MSEDSYRRTDPLCSTVRAFSYAIVAKWIGLRRLRLDEFHESVRFSRVFL